MSCIELTLKVFSVRFNSLYAFKALKAFIVRLTLCAQHTKSVELRQRILHLDKFYEEATCQQLCTMLQIADPDAFFAKLQKHLKMEYTLEFAALNRINDEKIEEVPKGARGQ